MERKITVEENISSAISAKGLVSRIYKEFSKLNKKTTNLFSLRAEHLYSTKETAAHVRRYSTSFVITNVN